MADLIDRVKRVHDLKRRILCLEQELRQILEDYTIQAKELAEEFDLTADVVSMNASRMRHSAGAFQFWLEEHNVLSEDDILELALEEYYEDTANVGL